MSTLKENLDASLDLFADVVLDPSFPEAEFERRLRQQLAAIASIRTGGDRPPTAEELARVQDQRTLTLPGRWETNGAVMADIVQMVRYGLPDWETYAGAVRSLSLAEIRAEADRVLQPDRMIWVVVGDRARIEESVRELDLGEIRFIDADGNPVEG